MNTNTNLLKSKMVLHGDTQIDLSNALGISRQSMSAKINNEAYFSQPEIKAIILRYNLTEEETNKIFFDGE